MNQINAEILAVADLYAEGLLTAAPGKEQQREVASQLADLVGFYGTRGSVRSVPESRHGG